MLERDSLISFSAQARFVLSESPLVPNALGLRDGFVAREKVMYSLHNEILRATPNYSCPREQLQEMEVLTQALPHPFWYGIHPSVLRQMVNNANEPESPFWQQRMAKTVMPAETKLIPTEPQVDQRDLVRQMDFVGKHLAAGSLTTIFATRGSESMWNKVPLASSFANDAHQMSIPDAAPSKVKGFNMLLLTSALSKIMPCEWNHDPEYSPQEWMNLHQIGHCKIIPTCWEYIDRTYSLVTPTELLELTVERNRNMARWFINYGMDIKTDESLEIYESAPYKPDTTSYLYEVKIIQRAAMVARSSGRPKVSELPGDLYWFRGFHLKEICDQLKLDEQEIKAAIAIMDSYWVENAGKAPTDPVLNSAIFSTDIGTHPAEEVCIDVLALSAVNRLPEHMSYWQGWVDKIDFYWNRWERESKSAIK